MENEIAQHIQQLAESRSHFARLAAAEALGTCGDHRATEPLLKALEEDTVPLVRACAAESLGTLGDPYAVEGLIIALRDRVEKVRQNAATALIALGGAAVSSLVAELREEDWTNRANAAKVLARVKDPRAVEPLNRALMDANWRVRSCVAHSLGCLQDERSVDPLLRLLRDRVEEVRRSAKQALNQWIENRDLLSRVLSARNLEPEQRVEILEWLLPQTAGEGDTSRRPPPVETFCQMMARSEEPAVRQGAEEALAAFKGRTLLRASTYDSSQENRHLLRAAPHGASDVAPEELLRLASPPERTAAEEAERRSWLERLLKRD